MTVQLFTREQILEHRKAWLEALRSGNYPQARDQLFDGDGYCCLGVACTVLGLEPVDYDGQSFAYAFGDEKNPVTLPYEGQVWLGLNTGNPAVAFPDGYQSLATLNDDGTWSFEDIADAIEEYGFDYYDDALQYQAPLAPRVA